MSTAHVVLPAAVLAALLALAPASAGARATACPAPASPVAQAVQSDVPARAGSLTLTWPELDTVVLDRHAGGQLGQEALEHLLQVAVVRSAAQARKLTVSELEIDERWSELDRQVRAGGEPEGLAGQLRANGLDPAGFRELLGVALLQEKLVRDALELPPDASLTQDQQELWIEAEFARRSVETLAAPWTEGVVARSGDAIVERPEFVEALRSRLTREDLREICYQILLERRARARLPDVTAEACAREVEREIDRRRAETAADPRYQGVAYEALLGAQGVTLAAVERDPALRAAALAWLWVDRLGEAGLRETYEARREYFEGTYGEALRGRILFLSAGQLKNELVKRDYEEAEAFLVRAARDVTTEEGFVELITLHAEDPQHRELGGESGWITRLSGNVPESLRDGLFAELEKGLPEGGKLTGPFRTPAGVLLFWLAETRPSPPWEEMRAHVHREERRRFLDESLPYEELVTVFD